MTLRKESGCSIEEWRNAWPAIVVWEDAAHQFGWLEGEEVEAQDGVVETVGWVVRSDEQMLIVAQSLTSGAHAQTLQIPAGMVRRVIPLEVVDGRA